MAYEPFSQYDRVAAIKESTHKVILEELESASEFLNHFEKALSSIKI